MHHGYDTFYYLEQLEATMLEALFSRENINGFYIVTYYPNNNGAYGGFSESFYNNLQVLHEHLQITEANNRFPSGPQVGKFSFPAVLISGPKLVGKDHSLFLRS